MRSIEKKFGKNVCKISSAILEWVAFGNICSRVVPLSLLLHCFIALLNEFGRRTNHSIPLAPLDRRTNRTSRTKNSSLPQIPCVSFYYHLCFYVLFSAFHYTTRQRKQLSRHWSVSHLNPIIIVH